MILDSINNISLFQKISLDELVKYEFMEEVQQELFDGSTSGKTLKESGFDFDQKFNVFYGNGDDYEVAGFTFGIADKEMLFEVFDDFQPMESEYPGVEFYISYFNRIAIKGNAGVLYRVTPNDRFVNDITDSVWYANGNEYPWYDDFYDEINWDEFWNVVKGNGPCNKQRLAARNKAHNDGAWVREAALAFAEKRKMRENQ